MQSVVSKIMLKRLRFRLSEPYHPADAFQVQAVSVVEGGQLAAIDVEYGHHVGTVGREQWHDNLRA